MTHEDVFERSLAELRTQVDRHHQCLRAALGKDVLEAAATPLPDSCDRQRLLCSVLLEGVKVLDETRRSFKSKPLELLRKRFLAVLSEELGDAPLPRAIRPAATAEVHE